MGCILIREYMGYFHIVGVPFLLSFSNTVIENKTEYFYDFGHFVDKLLHMGYNDIIFKQ